MMMQQHGQWGVRVPGGLRSLAAPWSEILLTSKLIVTEKMTDIMLFGPDVWNINRPGPTSRHAMHGYMILRDAIHAAVDEAPIMMKADLWTRLLDHRGWATLWGDIEGTKNPQLLADLKSLRDLFMRFVKKSSGDYPKPYEEVTYNGRVYVSVQEDIQPPPALANTSGPSEKSKRSRRAKTKAAQEAPDVPEQAPAPRKRWTLVGDVPPEDWDFLLWEMIELNHRGELRGLERKMHPGNEPQKINQLVANINGLAGVTCKDRRKSIVLLMGLMKNWRLAEGPFLNLHPEVQRYLASIDARRLPGFDGENTIAEQENTVLLLWARTFVEKFGRAPTPPRLCPTKENR